MPAAPALQSVGFAFVDHRRNALPAPL